ncbi:MAG: hypothetical protein Kow0022_02440 [Phycisphaerales bacterium]
MTNLGKLLGGAVLAMACGAATASGPQPVDAGAITRLSSDFTSNTLVVWWGAEANEAMRSAALAAVEGTVIGTDEDGAQLLSVGIGVSNARSLLEQFPASIIASVESTDSFVGNELGLDAHTIEVLSVPGNTRQVMYIPVVLDGGMYTLELRPSTVRSEDFRVLVDDGTGTLVEVPAPTPTTYRGRVVEIPDSVVAASINGGLTAEILFNDNLDDGWFIQPLTDAIEGVPGDVHVVYHGDASRPVDFSCGGALDHAELEGFAGIGVDRGGSRGNLTTAEIAYDADFQFYQLNGSNQANTIADIENVQNGINVVYERDCSITFVITQVVVRTSSGSNPYTTNDPGTLLDQFRSQWIQNHSGIHRDLAHLMTGRNLDSSVIGIAWLSAVCTSNAYGLSQSRFSNNFNNRVALTAHEVGHNFSAQHCTGSSCHIMCAGLGGCGGIGLPNFGTTSIASIVSYAATRSCLDSGPPQNQPPTITITTPISGSIVNQGDPVFFSVIASDDEDGDLSNSTVWSSNLDGVFATGSGFTYSGLSAGIHTITASVTDSGGLSDNDSIQITVNGGTTPPDQPTRPTTQDLGGGVARILWTDLPNEDEWDVQRQEKVNGVWTNTTTVASGLPANTTSYDDAAGFGTWRYRIRARNSAGNSPWSAWRLRKLVDSNPPSAPTNMNAVDLGGGQALLTWTDTSDSESKFQVQRQQIINGAWSNQGLIAQPPANTESLTDTPGAGSYRYRVRARNSSGASDWTPWGDGRVDVSP